MPPAATRPGIVVPPVLAVNAVGRRRRTARARRARRSRPPSRALGSAASAASTQTTTQRGMAAKLCARWVSDRHPSRVIGRRAPTRQLARVVSISRSAGRRPDTAGDRRRSTIRRQPCRSTCSSSSAIPARARPRARPRRMAQWEAWGTYTQGLQGRRRLRQRRAARGAVDGDDRRGAQRRARGDRRARSPRPRSGSAASTSSRRPTSTPRSTTRRGMPNVGYGHVEVRPVMQVPAM